MRSVHRPPSLFVALFASLLLPPTAGCGDGDSGGAPQGSGDSGTPGCHDRDGDGYGEGPQCAGADLPDSTGETDTNPDVYPGAPEICDGEDNDGDGLLDTEDDGFQRDPCPLVEGVCSQRGRACVFGVPGTCDADDYGPDYVAEEDGHCDGLDNDCDGETDEGCECVDDAVRACGACADGLETCRRGRWSACIGGREPGPEACNGLDDDCNGRVDDGGACGLCPFEMVYVQHNNLRLCIDRWEASRADANSASAGSSDDGPAESRPQRLPWADVPWNLARSACRRADKELCTGIQWQAACRAESNAAYPYGRDYDADACNGREGGEMQVMPTGSLNSCRVDVERGLFDMSGNLREWSADFQDNGQREVLGGSLLDDAPQLTCAAGVLLDDGTREWNTGFRCCRTLN